MKFLFHISVSLSPPLSKINKYILGRGFKKTGKGRTELVNITANTYLVTKQFGKDPHSREGIFPLKTGIIAMISCRALESVSECGCLFTAVCMALQVGQMDTQGPSPPGHRGRSLQMWRSHLVLPWPLLSLPVSSYQGLGPSICCADSPGSEARSSLLPCVRGPVDRRRSGGRHGNTRVFALPSSSNLKPGA